jgi:molybdopterin/thiamine biosynthesis adenylyltransferase
MPPWWPRRRKQRHQQHETTAAPEADDPIGTGSTVSSTNQALYSRNWAFISADLQERLANTTLFTAGAGLGSVVAALAARTGVQRFIVADGDVVEESNLNRQAFTRAHLGQSKAEATAAIIKDIQPAAHIEVVTHYLDTADCATLVPRADIILNTIDLDTPAFLELNRIARAAQKPVLFPLNPVWMGTVIVFTADSQTLDEFLDTEHLTIDQVSPKTLTMHLFEQIYAQVRGGMPEHMRTIISDYFDQDAAHSLAAMPDASSARYGAPQLGVTAYLTAALTVRALVALVAQEPVRVAPQVITADAFTRVHPLPFSKN